MPRQGPAAAAPQSGGCDFAVDPELEAPDAAVFWLPADAPAVVSLIATLPKLGLAGLTLAALAVADQQGEPGLAWLRLESGVVLVAEYIDDDVPLGVLLPLDAHWPVRLAAADRLHNALAGLPVEPGITPQRRERLKRALRATDGRRDGASYRGVGEMFFGAARVADEPWKTSPLKAQIVRLARYGRMMIDRGYRRLLDGSGIAPG